MRIKLTKFIFDAGFKIIKTRTQNFQKMSHVKFHTKMEITPHKQKKRAKAAWRMKKINKK